MRMRMCACVCVYSRHSLLLLVPLFVQEAIEAVSWFTTPLSVCFRKDCDNMADELSKANVAALSYHAGLGDSERSMVQQRWVQEDGCKVRERKLHEPN